MTMDDATVNASAETMKAALRADLKAAMKARQRLEVAAIRGAIAALDNAEAVEIPDKLDETTSAHIAGAKAGLGAGEAARRTLSGADVTALLRAQITSRLEQAASFQQLGHDASAEELRTEAQILKRYLT